MKNIASTLLLLFLLFIGCNQSPAHTQPSGTAELQAGYVNQSSGESKTPPEVLKLVRHQIVDKEGTGMVASTFLLPEGWTVQDRLYWEYSDATVPVRLK